MEALTGHTSPETAYVVDDYPYGFRLRCKIRYWLEYKPGNGYRLVSQTTNPKKPGEIWNKPKASTYCPVAAMMLLNDEGHVTWRGISHYNDTAQCEAFLAEYGHALSEQGHALLTEWIGKKQVFDRALAEGKVKFVATTTQIVG